MTPWSVACQAPLYMWFSRQEYWSGLHFLLQGIFLTQGWNWSLLPLTGRFFTGEPQGKPRDPRGVGLTSLLQMSEGFAGKTGAKKLELTGPYPTHWNFGTAPFSIPSSSQTFVGKYAILSVKVMVSGTLVYRQIKAELPQWKVLVEVKPWSPPPSTRRFFILCLRRSWRENSKPRLLWEKLELFRTVWKSMD